MSNNKTHKNINDKIFYNNFFLNCFNFNNLKLESQKYDRCLQLIEDSKKIKEVKEIDKPSYYYSLAELYFYASKKEAQRHNLANGKIFNVEEFLDKKNMYIVQEILKYKEISLENYNRVLKIVVKLDTINDYKRITEGIRIMSQELSIIYYIINDIEKFIKYGKCAVEYNSLNAMYIFLKYYCDEKDYDSAFYYLELIRNYASKNINISIQNIITIISSFKIYYSFSYELGMYNESLIIAQELKKYLLNIHNEVFELKKYEYIKIVNEHIKKCKFKIDISKEFNYNDDKLRKYFDENIINLISEDNKIYILTSLYIYDFIKSQKLTMDYSATLMPILKAIENIMFEILGNKYHSYIQNGVRIDIWTHFMRGCIIDYVH